MENNQSETTDIRNIRDNEEIVEVLDKLEKLDPAEKETVIATMEMYRGPIPHPNILKGYEDLYPGAAEKIINNGIGESEHRREMEIKMLKQHSKEFSTKYYLAFILCLVFLIASFYLILNDHVITGSVFAGTTFLVIIGTFLGNNDNNQNEKNNENEMTKSTSSLN